jgi:hypothetical protein
MDDLMVRYSRTRFGFRTPTDDDAAIAESLSSALCLEMET